MILASNKIIKRLKSELAMIQEDFKSFFFDSWKGSLGLVGRLIEHMCNIWLGTIAEQSVQTYMEKRNYDTIGDVFLKQIEATTQTFVTTPTNKLFLSEENESEIDGLKHYIKNFIQEPSKSSIGLNYLFVGVPGTGKTYSMKIIWQFLKQNSGQKKYKCFFFPGSFFKKYSEQDAVKAISALFENINKLIDEGSIVALFVDEIDALLAGGDNRSDLLNHFLSNISNLIDKSDARGKFITIGSSNHPQVIDEANARRFKMIRFESPSEKQKAKMFLYYIEKYCKQFNIFFQVSEKFIEAIVGLENTITGSDIENIIKQTVAFCMYSASPKKLITITEEDILKQFFNIVYTKYELSLKLPQNLRDNFLKKSNEIIKTFQQTHDIDALKCKIIELKKYMLIN